MHQIRKDSYFDIIQLKYLNTEEDRVKTDNELVEILDKERITIIRNRKRLINKLTTILFPQNVRELL